MSLGSPPRCHFVPPYLLSQLAIGPVTGAPVDPETAAIAARTLRVDERIRAERGESALAAVPAARVAWSVYSADNGTRLPGRRVRVAGGPEVSDAAVDEAALGGSAALALFGEVYGRDSIDDAGAEVVMTVHYGRDYDNAFWNGRQLVFGDGDGRIFERFTKPVDVLAHELTHAVTERTAGLEYRDQPGALNESMSDVFAACTKQRLLAQTVTAADWLIGQGLFRPGINARGLRDMAAPGTAYDDPQLGRDPQPDHMSGYVDTADDNGGVHLNSGIPNRAFYLAATAVGGYSWTGAGAIWYAALTGPRVTATSDFSAFAAATVEVAGPHAAAVLEAWQTVGVDPGGTPSSTPPPPPSGNQVEVRRSGGLLGRTTAGQVDLAGGGARAEAVRALVAGLDLRGAHQGLPHPDMFVYTFSVPGQPTVSVPEHELTDELRHLAALVLTDDTGS